MSAFEGKRTCLVAMRMSAFDQKRTFTRMLGLNGNCNRLWRLARDHIFRPGSGRNRRRREDRKIRVATGGAIEADLAVSYGRKLTAQKIWRGAMFGRRLVGVENAATGARLKRGNEVVEQAVGLGDFVIHVYENCNVEGIG